MNIEVGTYVTVTCNHKHAPEPKIVTGTVTHVFPTSADGSYSVYIDGQYLVVIGDFVHPRTGEVVASNTIEPTTRPV